MSSAVDLITRAMRRAGVLAAGETPEAPETQDALAVLNDILQLWALESLMVHVRRAITHTVNGSQTYTIGAGQDIDTERPTSISSAIYRLSGDFPLDIVSDADYDNVIDKGIGGMPVFLHYTPDLPYGTIDLWPVPTSGELVLYAPKKLGQAAVAGDDLVLPPGYGHALFLALTIDLCLDYQRQIPNGLPQEAQDALAVIKRDNIQQDMAAFDTALVVREPPFEMG